MDWCINRDAVHRSAATSRHKEPSESRGGRHLAARGAASTGGIYYGRIYVGLGWLELALRRTPCRKPVDKSCDTPVTNHIPFPSSYSP